MRQVLGVRARVPSLPELLRLRAAHRPAAADPGRGAHRRPGRGRRAVRPGAGLQLLGRGRLQGACDGGDDGLCVYVCVHVYLCVCVCVCVDGMREVCRRHPWMYCRVHSGRLQGACNDVGGAGVWCTYRADHFVGAPWIGRRMCCRSLCILMVDVCCVKRQAQFDRKASCIWSCSCAVTVGVWRHLAGCRSVGSCKSQNHPVLCFGGEKLRLWSTMFLT